MKDTESAEEQTGSTQGPGAARLLVVEDDAGVRTTVVTFLELEGYQVDAVSSTREAIERLNQNAYPIVLTDIYLDEKTGLDVLEAARTKNPSCAVILMTARGTMETVMAATRGGAFDYIAKPFDFDALLKTIKRAEASLTETVAGDETDIDDLPESEMIGSSAEMVAIYKIVSRVAPTDATVLVEGETGTGKELIARMIHTNSPRTVQPFVAVDCASIAPALLESELFGALRGAYTGADRDRMGVFEAANHGTVFLDEIGDIELNFQLKMLRFLQEREIRPLGSPRSKSVDVRVLAATNRDLQQLVDEGKFREDLWFRVNVVRIQVPPLRERRGDVPLLAHFFLRKYNARYGQSVRIAESGLRTLDEYTWPGNVRQLQHMMERLTILAPGGRIDQDVVQEAIRAMEPHDDGGETLAETEMDQIRKVLSATGGNKSRAARILGIERKTLYRKLDRLNA
ncbi:MAG: sigma-54 dependent transcriptional regulator [Bryobacteraceae bacterium]